MISKLDALNLSMNKSIEDLNEEDLDDYLEYIKEQLLSLVLRD